MAALMRFFRRVMVLVVAAAWHRLRRGMRILVAHTHHPRRQLPMSYDELVEDDASGAGSWKSEAASDSVSESEYSFEMSEESSDEILDEPVGQHTCDVPAAGLYSADLILTAAAMSQRQRALRKMFTGGTGVPVSSGQGSVAEPATWELLMLVEMTLLRLRSSRRRSAGRCS